MAKASDVIVRRCEKEWCARVLRWLDMQVMRGGTHGLERVVHG
jgi:hypothetical protein